jgi:rubrerythrin
MGGSQSRHYETLKAQARAAAAAAAPVAKQAAVLAAPHALDAAGAYLKTGDRKAALNVGAQSALAAAARYRGAGEPYLGGCGCDDTVDGVPGGYFGGAEDADKASAAKSLRSYATSLAYETKAEFARKLATGLKDAGIAVDPDSGLQAIAEALTKKLPNPRKNKQTFKDDADKAEEICKTVARVLNNAFTPGADKAHRLIDTDQGAVAICRQVSELAHSMATGMHAEFLETHRSLEGVLKRIVILRELLQDFHRRLYDTGKKDAEPEDERLLRQYDDAYDRINTELDRQVKLLEGFLNVTLAPAQEELKIAMKELGETNDMIKKLKLGPGDKGFGDALADSVYSTGAASAVACKVQEALKTVGMSLDSYLDSSDYEALLEAIDKARDSFPKGKSDYGKFASAAEELRNAWSRADVKKALREDNVGSECGSVRGGDERKTDMDKRVERQKRERKLIVKEFADKLMRHYDGFLKSVEEIGPRIGKEIPVSDALGSLRDAISRLGTQKLGAVAFELSLMGFYSNAQARAERESFTNSLALVVRALDEVMALQMYGESSRYFAAIRAAIEGIQRTIDFYAGVAKEKYGSDPLVGGEEGGDEGGEGGEGGEAAVTGGDLRDEVKDTMPEIARMGYDLTRAVNAFVYFFYVAKVKENLRRSHKELEFYGEKYDDMLGQAVAARIRVLADAKKTKLKNLPPIPTNVAMPPEGWTAPKAGAAIPAVLGGGGNYTTEQEAAYGRAKAMIEAEFKCKKNFYNAVQAIDLYMKAFTDAITSNPGDVAAIKEIVDDVTVIGRWFVDATGDHIAHAFEGMNRDPDGNAFVAAAAGANPAPANASGIWNLAGDHYYNKLAAQDAGDLVNERIAPGHPLYAVSPQQADTVQEEVELAWNKFQALKNIMNAFARIGARFGGRDLKSETFMSPAEIYDAINAYLKCSALSISSVAAQNVDTPGGAPAPAWAAENNHYAVYFGSVSAGFEGNYATEDLYFTLTVKAMAAKILTVVGVYDLFERPSPVYGLTPTRMIIGGSDYDADVSVIPEAAELYFRIIRLAEFYKRVLSVNLNLDADAKQIALLPEMEGVFSGLISIIFLDTNVAEGEYTEREIKGLVRVVNGIYEHFKAKGDTPVHDALEAFVAEINRRYGITQRAEYNKLVKILRDSGQYQAGLDNENRTNYAILPDEGRQVPARRAPSDRYEALGERGAEAELDSKYKLDEGTSMANWAQWQLLKTFRGRIMDEFEKLEPQQYTALSYNQLIAQGRREMQDAPADKRLAIASRLIQGAPTLTGLDASKSLMFHETVVVGLNTLSAVYTQLASIRELVNNMDLARIRGEIKSWLQVGEGNGVAAPVANRANLVAHLGGLDPHPIGERYIMADGAFYDFQGGMPENATAAAMYAWAEALLAAGRAAQANKVPAARIIGRFGVDNQAMMRDLIGLLSALVETFGDMVAVKYPDTATAQLQIDFSGLRNQIVSLFESVRQYLNMFRPLLDTATIAKYEKRIIPGTTNENNTGSLEWLESNLMQDLVQGLPGREFAPGSPGAPRTLEWVSRTLNSTYVELTKQQDAVVNSATFDPGAPAAVQLFTLEQANGIEAGPGVGIAAAVAALGNQAPLSPKQYTKELYGRVLAEYVYYDGTRPNSGFTGTAADLVNMEAPGPGLISLIATERPRQVQGAVNAAEWARIRVDTARRVNLWQVAGEDIKTGDRSLMMLFNQLVSLYLNRFYDKASGKIYKNLIDSFANGAFSRAVMSQGFSHPDLATAAGGVNPPNGFGQRSDPQPGVVLLTSLALILQRMELDMNPTNQLSDHLAATLTEVPLYIKESYRANLPVFAQLFEMVQRRGQLLKQLVTQTQIATARTVTARDVGLGANDFILSNGNTYAANAGQWGTEKLIPASVMLTADEARNQDISEDKSRTYFIALLDSIGAGVYSMYNSASEVLRELSDEPLYLQTQEGSIAEYKARYGRQPLMPISLLTTFFKNIVAPTRSRLMPTHAVGDIDFGFQYGTRKLLAKPKSQVALGEMPGVKALLDDYNRTASGQDRADDAKFEGFLGSLVGCARFVIGLRYLSTQLAISDQFGADTLSSMFSRSLLRTAPNPLGAIRAGRDDTPNAAYSVRASPEETLTVVTSSDQPQQIRLIVGDIGAHRSAGIGAGNRELEQAANIIDMNIIPINVHALMRGIPLAPTYNYAYTFEQMVCLMYGETVGNVEDRVSGTRDEFNGNPDIITNTRQMFLKLLIKPYSDVLGPSLEGSEMGASNMFLNRIVSGDDSLMMGRPKFLSDQLANKALMNTIVPLPSSWDESGPAGSNAFTRGANSGSILELPQTSALIVRDAGGAPNVAAAQVAVAAAAAADLPVPNDAIQDRADAIAHNTVRNYFAALPALPAANPPIADTVVNRVLDVIRVVNIALVNDGFAPMAVKRVPGAINRRFTTMESPPQRPPLNMPAERSRTTLTTNALSYTKIGEGGQPTLVVVPIDLGISPTTTRDRLRWISKVGKARFDTRMVRNMWFLANVQRLIRLRLQQELTEYRSVIVPGHSIVNASVTEYGSLPAQIRPKGRIPEFTGMNEVADSRHYGDEERWDV